LRTPPPPANRFNTKKQLLEGKASKGQQTKRGSSQSIHIDIVVVVIFVIVIIFIFIFAASQPNKGSKL
jgi:hypothetical protein